MKKFTFIFVGFFCITAFLYAQNADLKTYFEGHFIAGIADDVNNIWVGVDSLLVKMDKTTGETISWTVPISNEYNYTERYASSISFDSNGLAWIICSGPLPYLVTFDGVNTWEEIPLPNSWVSDLIIDKEDKVWLSTIGGLSEYTGTGWIEYNSSNTELPYSAINALAVDNQNNKWLSYSFDGMYGPGYIAKYDNQHFITYPFDSQSIIWSIDISPSGTLWMGTWISGLIKFDGTNWEVYNPSIPGLPANSFEYVKVEGESIIWISPTIGIGLIRFDGVNWETFNTDNSILPSNNINSILIEENGTKWVGTDNGLISFTGNSLSTFDDQFSGVQFNLFPNPANDFITLKMPLEVLGSTVEIYNILGKSMKSFRTFETNIRLDVSSFANGLYFIRLQTNNGMAIKKFVKQN